MEAEQKYSPKKNANGPPLPTQGLAWGVSGTWESGTASSAAAATSSVPSRSTFSLAYPALAPKDLDIYLRSLSID